MENELQTIEEGNDGEWTRYQIILPVDDYDEDDEIDELIEKQTKLKKTHVTRGNNIYGI
jgi:hypothetical protein